MRNRTLTLASVGAVAVVTSSATPAWAGFLDVHTIDNASITTSFMGSLDGVAVAGIGTRDLSTNIFGFNVAGTGHSGSTTDGTSPQYGYASIYSPAAAFTDRVGYTAYPGYKGRLTITLGAPVTNLRFHVAELDGMAYAFDLAGGLTGVSLVSGNGGGGDGLQVVGSTVSDADPATFGGLGNTSFSSPFPPTTPPPTTGDRPAYGTVSLNGTYTALTIGMTSIGDGGSFTLSSVPEPTAAAALAASGLVLRRRHRAKG